MPYVADPDEATIASVRDRLLAVACRHADTGADAFVRIPRTKLHALACPEIRREDFYEAIRRLAEDTTAAIHEATGTGRRADVVLDRVVDEVGEWEDALYDVFPDDTPEPEDVHAYLNGKGLDTTSPIPTDLLVKRTPRPRVVHDPEQPRTCAKCSETKPTTGFDRRSADPEEAEYHRFQSYCRDCARGEKREWAADNGDPRTTRPERWGGRSGLGRPGARHPNSDAPAAYQFTN